MQHARTVAEYAYAPYSRFKVGAALLLSNGHIVTGCNVENSSYRLTNCAEQGAISAAVAKFGPKVRIRAVGVANVDVQTACMPCGACRQTILEFATDDCWVFFPGQSGCPRECAFSDLLPESFRLAH
ncbi:MAG: cytidine deaminase [Acidobacteria bacterium]|nr:cytidine deaminase [Acidobacteriota bacterium]